MLLPTRSFVLLATLQVSLLHIGCTGLASRAEEPMSDTPPEAERESPGAVEELDANAIRRVVEAGEGPVQSCYQQWLDALDLEEVEAAGELRGRLMVSFIVMESGAVEEVRIEESEPPGAPFQDCVLREVARWRFPPPGPEQAPLRVEVPFLFEPRLEEE